MAGTIDRDHELVSFAERDGGVDAVLRTPRGDDTVRAGWLVGCDGAHSAVRHLLSLPFEGAQYDATFMLADVETNEALRGDELHRGALETFAVPKMVMNAIDLLLAPISPGIGAPPCARPP